ncbi:MAG: 7TM diverse intracellular signaling domain-containing protein [SAR324 cluster bacterium]|nr:7TM diverse intracellular signaling domain-containing protein [SAR324 cluster bacterium]
MIKLIKKASDFITYTSFLNKYPQDGTNLRITWGRFDLLNSSNKQLNRTLYIEDWVEEIQIWRLQENTFQQIGIRSFKGEGLYPGQLTPYPYFYLYLQPGKNQYFIKYRSYSTALKEFSIYKKDQFYSQMTKANTSYALILGVLLIMGLYNLILSIVFKSSEGIYFSAYIWSISICLILRDRLVEAWFNLSMWPDWLTNQTTAAGVFAVGFFFQAQYCTKMLGITKKNKVILYWIYSLVFFLLISYPLWFINAEWAALLANNVAALLVLTLLFVALTYTVKRRKNAWILSLSFFPPIAGGVMEMLNVQKGIQIINNPWQLGICLEVIILSAYMALRIKDLREEKERASAQLVETLKDQTLILEEKVQKRTTELASALDMIQGSITYAKQIQDSLLPNKSLLELSLAEHFIFWEPRDTVGGDLYLCDKCPEGIYIILLDCTGHSIPGAFMTMLAASTIKQLVQEGHVSNPANMLQKLTKNLQELLYHQRSGAANDGLDGAICFIPNDEGKLIFAGARQQLYLVKNSEVTSIKGDKESVGYRNSNPNYTFTNHEIALKDYQTFYLCSDGIPDQRGGKKGFPMGQKKFISLLAKISDLPFKQQKDAFLKEFASFENGYSRQDDIAFIGFKP